MKYTMYVDVITDSLIDRRTQEILRTAVSTIITDNLECEVPAVRLSLMQPKLSTSEVSS